MDRRTVLASAGIVVAGLSGCAGDPDRDDESTPTERQLESDPTEPEPQRPATGDPVTVADGTSLMVADSTVQQSIVAYHSQFLSIEREDGLQFVVVDVVGDADFEPSSFVLKRNGDVESPPRTQQYVRRVVGACDGTCIGIPVDAEAATSAAIAYRPDDELRAVWELDDATVAALPTVPALRLRDAAVTEQNGEVGVEFSVDNVGERDGVFLGLVAPAWVADVAEPFGFTVPRGDTVTETLVPNEIQRLDPDEAGFSTEPTDDTRYFEIGSKP
jgi:hypothetical protein